MTEYLLCVTGGALFYAVCEFMLPEGGLKRFAAQVMLIIIMCALLSPILFIAEG